LSDTALEIFSVIPLSGNLVTKKLKGYLFLPVIRVGNGICKKVEREVWVRVVARSSLPPDLADWEQP
jgi:hypothetical protein